VGGARGGKVVDYPPKVEDQGSVTIGKKALYMELAANNTTGLSEVGFPSQVG